MLAPGVASSGPLYTRPPINTARQLLCHLRGGDYAHAGDKAAVDMVIERALALSPDIQSGPCLDVGSGFGGTAAYIGQLHFNSIHGIDLDEAAVMYAKEQYPQINFIAGDALKVSESFEQGAFTFLYMFNVSYAIEDKVALLQQLHAVAKSGALLAIFDYTTLQSPLRMNDLAGKPMHPIVVDQFLDDCRKTDWNVIEVKDVTQSYIMWYQDLLEKLERESPALLENYSDSDISRVKKTFTFLLDELKKGQIGGGILYLKKP